MEKYTETAAIEQHSFNVETYNDASNQLCISSEEDAEVTLLMRNPKQYSIIPSVNFNNLAGSFSRSAVDIQQTELAVIHMDLPQEFLIPVDEGQDITAEIDLYEPMSGRNFDRYTLQLSCNTKPPAILNPTIINNNNSTFVIAFDMPNEEEVAIRHKDLASIEINGKSYPVSVSVITDPNADPETPDVKIAQYAINDSHFTRTWNNNYRILNSKSFTQTNNSFYYETDDAFFAGDKEYSLILRDRAGLTSEVMASTKISKLQKPLILDQNGNEIAEDGLVGIPYDEDLGKGSITIIPPTQDHLGNTVSGVTVYYKVYEATGSGLIYTSGTTTSTKSIELPQNTYRVEAYAVLTNYENSSTTTVKFRLMNNVLYVRACTDLEGFRGDGSERAPFATIQEAIADINDTENRPDKADKFTIYVEGDFTTSTYYIDVSDPENPTVVSDVYGDINLSGTMNTDQLVIAKNPRASASNGAKLKSITIDNTVDLSKVTIGSVTVTNSGGNGITQNNENTLLIIDGAEITNSSNGVTATTGTINFVSGLISDNTDSAFDVSDCMLNISGGTISLNGASGAPAIAFEDSDDSDDELYILAISGGNIIQNKAAGISITGTADCNLMGGNISQNAGAGITLGSGVCIYVQDKPIVTGNNTSDPDTPMNIVLPKDIKLVISGPLISGASIGITTHSNNEPSSFDDEYQFTWDYNIYNTASPSDFFISDKGFAIINSSGDAVIKMSGASGNENIPSDYSFEFAKTTYSVRQGRTTTLKLTPIVKKLGYQITYGSEIEGHEVTWAADLYSGTTFLCNLPVTNVSGGISLTIPAQEFMGSYKIQLQVTFMQMQHNLDVTLSVNNLIGEKLSPDAVGDIVFSDGSAINYTAELEFNDEQKQKAVAYIFKVDGGKVLGVGFKQTQKAWAKSGVPGASERIPDADGNGHFDVEDVKLYAAAQGSEYNEENYPAFWWTEHYGVAVKGDSSGWYLAGEDDTSAYVGKRYSINAIINKIGESSDFVKFPTGVSAQFTTSTQNYNYTYCVNTKGYNASDSSTAGNKGKTDDELYLRAVREF